MQGCGPRAARGRGLGGPGGTVRSQQGQPPHPALRPQWASSQNPSQKSHRNIANDAPGAETKAHGLAAGHFPAWAGRARR